MISSKSTLLFSPKGLRNEIHEGCFNVFHIILCLKKRNFRSPYPKSLPSFLNRNQGEVRQVHLEHGLSLAPRAKKAPRGSLFGGSIDPGAH